MEPEGVDAIRIDRQQGVYEAVKYLNETGRKHIAYVGFTTGRPHDPLFYATGTRLQGYVRAMSELGKHTMIIPLPLEIGNYEGGKGAIEPFLKLSPQPDAVQVFADDMAMGFLAALHEHGIRVPQDVAVVGFNGCPYGQLAWPPLTTVAQPLSAVGERAAEVLLDKLEGKPAPVGGWSESLPTSLLLRETA